MSGNRGSSLAKIECMMEHEFEVSAGDQSSLFQLMDKDLFLFPTVDRVSTLSELNITHIALTVINWTNRNQANTSVLVRLALRSRLSSSSLQNKSASCLWKSYASPTMLRSVLTGINSFATVQLAGVCPRVS
jgi:hypothetical protein